MNANFLFTNFNVDLHKEMIQDLAVTSQVDPTPCVLFAFTRQPAEDQWTTRIGGLPAWPQALEWPTCSECEEPLAFVTQLDFRSTKTGFDTLIFHYCFGCEPESGDDAARITTLVFDENLDLIEEPVIPEELEDDEPGPCFGVPRNIDDYDTKTCALGTKIGGVAPMTPKTDRPSNSTNGKMDFLGLLCGLNGSELQKVEGTPSVGDLEWPYLNCIFLWHSSVEGKDEVKWTLADYLESRDEQISSTVKETASSEKESNSATDPARPQPIEMDELPDEWSEYLEAVLKRWERDDYVLNLPKGAKESAIEEAEQALNIRFPVELRELYLAHNGVSFTGSSTLNEADWLLVPVEEIGPFSEQARLWLNVESLQNEAERFVGLAPCDNGDVFGLLYDPSGNPGSPVFLLDHETVNSEEDTSLEEVLTPVCDSLREYFLIDLA